MSERIAKQLWWQTWARDGSLATVYFWWKTLTCSVHLSVHYRSQKPYYWLSPDLFVELLYRCPYFRYCVPYMNMLQVCLGTKAFHLSEVGPGPMRLLLGHIVFHLQLFVGQFMVSRQAIFLTVISRFTLNLTHVALIHGTSERRLFTFSSVSAVNVTCQYFRMCCRLNDLVLIHPLA